MSNFGSRQRRSSLFDIHYVNSVKTGDDVAVSRKHNHAPRGHLLIYVDSTLMPTKKREVAALGGNFLIFYLAFHIMVTTPNPGTYGDRRILHDQNR